MRNYLARDCVPITETRLIEDPNMLESIVTCLLLLVAGVLILTALIAVPLLLIGVVAKAAFFLILLPLRLIGLAFGLLFGAGMIFAKIVGVLIFLAICAVLLPLAVLAIPLVPFILVVLAVGLFVRLVNPAHPRTA